MDLSLHQAVEAGGPGDGLEDASDILVEQHTEVISGRQDTPTEAAPALVDHQYARHVDNLKPDVETEFQELDVMDRGLEAEHC